jgi:hypothetical protein
LALVACGGAAQNESTDAGEVRDAVDEGGLQLVEIPARWATANAADLRALIRSSDEVFLGRVTGVVGQSEADRPPGMNPRRQALPVTSFEVFVTEAHVGNLARAETVIIEQVGGTIPVQGGGASRVVLEGDEVLERGAEYLFFADRKADGALTVPPFGRLQVRGDGSLAALEQWSGLGALQQLTGLSVSAAVAKVERAR